MKPLMAFIKTTLIGGLLFLVPFAATMVVLSKAVKFAAKGLRPIEQILPERSFLGVAFVDVLAIIVLLAIGFFAGLIARTAMGKQLRRKAEALVLGKIPGYTLLKGVAEGSNPIDGTPSLKVALATIDDAWLLSFIVEEHPDGKLIVFVPSAPTPAAGNVYVMEERQVKRLDVPVASAVKCIMQLGVGAGELLHPKYSKDEKSFQASA